MNSDEVCLTFTVNLKDYSQGREWQFIKGKLFRRTILVDNVLCEDRTGSPRVNDEATNEAIKCIGKTD